VAQQVERAIVGGLRRGEEHLKLRLKPPELGELRLELALRGENLKVVMVAETAAARDSLQAALPELRGSLADQGLKLEQFSVSVRHEGANTFGQQWGRPHQGGTPQTAPFIEQAEGGAAAPAAWADAGRIDVFC
jgi:flagellar hook-length control protein FliK